MRKVTVTMNNIFPPAYQLNSDLQTPFLWLEPLTSIPAIIIRNTLINLIIILLGTSTYFMFLVLVLINDLTFSCLRDQTMRPMHFYIFYRCFRGGSKKWGQLGTKWMRVVHRLDLVMVKCNSRGKTDTKATKTGKDCFWKGRNTHNLSVLSGCWFAKKVGALFMGKWPGFRWFTASWDESCREKVSTKSA